MTLLRWCSLRCFSRWVKSSMRLIMLHWPQLLRPRVMRRGYFQLKHRLAKVLAVAVEVVRDHEFRARLFDQLLKRKEATLGDGEGVVLVDYAICSLGRGIDQRLQHHNQKLSLNRSTAFRRGKSDIEMSDLPKKQRVQLGKDKFTGEAALRRLLGLLSTTLLRANCHRELVNNRVVLRLCDFKNGAAIRRSVWGGGASSRAAALQHNQLLDNQLPVPGSGNMRISGNHPPSDL